MHLATQLDVHILIWLEVQIFLDFRSSVDEDSMTHQPRTLAIK